MPDRNLERHRREGLRADILLILDRARPIGTTERIILLPLGDSYIDVGPNEVRRELDYLSEKGLVRIANPAAIWHADLTADGVDVVEGAAGLPPGIAGLFRT